MKSIIILDVLGNFFDDPVLVFVFGLVVVIAIILIGRPFVAWFYKIDDQIKLLEEIAELQKEQLKAMKGEKIEDKNQKI